MAKGYNRGPATGAGGGGMAGQLRKLQEQMAMAQELLAHETVSATAGGGAVKVTMTGDQHCTAVEVDAEFLKEADAEMLQDMLLTAVNQALDASRKLQETRMGPLAGGMSGMGLGF